MQEADDNEGNLGHKYVWTSYIRDSSVEDAVRYSHGNLKEPFVFALKYLQSYLQISVCQ
jgi:hypothetical protein